MRLDAVVAASAALAMATRAGAETICPLTRKAPPAVPTLMASTANPEWEAWLVNPDCSSKVRKIEPDYSRVVELNVKDLRVGRVDSVPSKTMEFVGVGISRGGDFTAATKLSHVLLASLPNVRDLVLPDSVSELSLWEGTIEDLDGLKLPPNISILSIEHTKLKSLKNVALPRSLESLNLDHNQLTEVDFVVPPNVWNLELSSNPITKLENLNLPDKLTFLSCKDCPITSVRGVAFPQGFSAIDLGSATVTTFEIRESDVAVFENMLDNQFSATLRPLPCSDSTARVVPLARGDACVITDKRFQERYGIAPPPPPTAPPSPAPSMPPSGVTPASPSTAPYTSPSGSASASSNSSTPSSAPSSSSTTTSPAGPEDDLSSPATATGSRPAKRNDGTTARPNEAESTLSAGRSNTNPTVSGSNAPSSVPQGSGSIRATTKPNKAAVSDHTSGSDEGTSNTDSTQTASVASSSTNSLALVLAIVGSIVVLLVGAMFYRAVTAARRTKSEDPASPTTYNSLATPKADDAIVVAAAVADAQEYLPNDIRNDPTLAAARIDGSALQLGAPIARGGFGIVYKGSLNGQDVAIKKMLPDSWRDEATVACFMDEIRLCVRLQHPKIVACVGVSYTSLRDLAVVTELMTGGDLSSVLEKQRTTEPTGREWLTPWTDAKLQSKSSIALDVAEALVYLHAFETPIIHRDLKAKNVLLDVEGHAKLSDFGISREVSMDETMTREVGTVAWIAPEVLRGEQYSEKADIYSLGVLLVEMDRCRHPYAHEEVLSGNASDASSLPIGVNTKIAILVSTGALRPTPTTTCPHGVADLMQKCLAFDAAERPTADAVVEMLRATQEEAR